MGVLRGTRKFVWIICLLLMTAGATAQAQSGTGEYHPEPFQDGKDVVWVPTAQALADKMLNLARVTPQDYVIDLGSGDGRLVITAAKRGARALGIEYNPDLVTLARRNAAREGVQDRATFLQGDLFESDFSEATVITMFLLQEINLKLRPKILELKPGTRIVSNTFDMGDWTPDETVYVSPDKGCDNNFCMGYFWIVPAKVEGTWQFGDGKLLLVQRYQRIFGEYQSDKKPLAITGGKLEGDRIRFTLGGKAYSGQVRNGAIRGTVKEGGKTRDWSANWIYEKLQ